MQGLGKPSHLQLSNKDCIMAGTIILWKAVRGFYMYTTCKKMVREKVELLLNGIGDPIYDLYVKGIWKAECHVFFAIESSGKKKSLGIMGF